jgi:hypothetical protein
MTRKTTLEEACLRFLAKGKTLLATEYKDNKTKMPYRCQCGKEDCQMSLNQLDHGNDNCLQCSQKKRKETMVERYGRENPSQVPELQAKKIETSLRNWGTEYPLQNEEQKAQYREVMVERYGVNNPSQVPEFQEKKRQTWLTNLGVDHPFKSSVVLEKRKATWVVNYGEAHPSKCEAIKEQKKETCRRNFGVDYPSQSVEIQALTKANYRALHGVDHHMQVPEIFARVQASSFRNKDYTFPSGTTIQVQGYEPFCYEHLLAVGFTEEELLTGYQQRPVVNFHFDGKQCTYYPDLYLPNEHTLIEVKSAYTYQLAPEKNQAKLQACCDAGYHAELWIYDRNGDWLERLLLEE